MERIIFQYSSKSISVTLGCGGTASENCTYFESTGNEMGACRAKICPCNDNICQMRLDFNSFVINQPSTCKLKDVQKLARLLKISKLTATTSVAIINNNKNAYPASQCITDQFMVTTPGSNPPPMICGTNTGEHSKDCIFSICEKI